MRRRYLLAVLAAAPIVAAGIFIVLKPSFSPAEQGNAAVANPAPVKPGAQLPITQVILFSSGVGYFQREGEVDGNARINLTFPVEDINDLLKSMVLQDRGGGHISAVSYDSHDPVEKTLKSFAINLTNNPSLGQIMQQARGEKIEVVVQHAAQPGALTGTIIGLEKQRQPAGKDGVVEVEMLNLSTADGIRSVKLGDVQRIRFLNPLIDNEFRRALDVLALSHDTQKKAVSLSFTGQGKRPVSVSYVVENPIWKTSYRLSLDKKGKLILQGWAVVENPSDEDWSNVRMALVSGRPISFRMDLYQPLYVPRPVVEPELFASLRPPTYSGAMERDKAAALGAAPASAAPQADVERKKVLKQLADRAFITRQQAGLEALKDAEVNFRRGVASAATATDMGNFFQYVIDDPVNLARQKSAILPIVQKEIEGTKVSIYNEETHDNA